MVEGVARSVPKLPINQLGVRSLVSLLCGCGLIAIGLLGNYLLAGRSTKLSWDVWLSAGALCFVLAGLHLILYALRPRFSKSGHAMLATCIVLGYVLVYTFSLGLAFIGSQGDYGHCEEIIQSVAATAPIPPSAFFPTRPAVDCKEANYGLFRTRFQVVDIYGVADMPKHDEILLKLRDLKRTNKTQAMQVLFYDRENVHMWKNDQTGAGGGIRGPESIIRVATVR